MNFARLLLPANLQQTAKAFASGRWWPQPSRRRSFCTASADAREATDELAASAPTASSLPSKLPTAEELGLRREDAHPVFAPRRGPGRVFKLVPGPKGELLAGYTLFEAAIKRSEVNWRPYDAMTKAEKDVYMAHLRAVEARKLEYRDPHDKKALHKTIAALLYAGECCGEGCRHCPYELDACSEETRKRLVFNGVYYV